MPAPEARVQDQFMFCPRADMFSAKARKFLAKAWKFLISAQKIFAKFNTIRLRPSKLQSGFDVNSFLQVETFGIHNCSAFSSDLQACDHVKLFDSLASFPFELSSSQRILPRIVNDHVKHLSELSVPRRDHVKLCLELPCSDRITSDLD